MTEREAVRRALQDLARDFITRECLCLTNPDAFDKNAAGVWGLAADAVREKIDAL